MSKVRVITDLFLFLHHTGKKFANYKEQVIDLLKRVCALSVETMKVVAEMEK